MATPSTKTPSKKTNIKDLALLFAIPAIIAIVTALIVYVPQFLANPQTSFIYCTGYNCNQIYAIGGDGYVTQTVATNNYPQDNQLRYYDAQADATRGLTYSQAQQYRLDDSSKSPDGYTLSRQQSSSGFLLWDNYSDGWVLKNGSKKKPIELGTTSNSYYDIHLVGWVVQ